MDVKYEKLYFDRNKLFYYHKFKTTRFTSPFHLHDEFELILIEKSHGKLYIGSNVINFNDEDLFLFAPKLPHCFYNPRGYEDSNVLAEAIVIHFYKDFLGKSFFDKIETTQLHKLIKKSEFGVQFINTGEELKKRIKELNKKNYLEKLGEFIFILNDLSTKKEVVLLSTEDIFKLKNLAGSKIINDIYQYVAENFQKKINFDTAASIANMQRSAFSRYFKRKTRKTFSEFVNETRIKHACKLLSETDKTIIEIAFESGFENTSYFNRKFKIHNNVTPSQYRDQIIFNNPE